MPFFKTHTVTYRHQPSNPRSGTHHNQLRIGSNDGHSDIQQQEGAVPVVPFSGPLGFNIPKSSSSSDDEWTGHGHADIHPEDAVPVVPLSAPLNNQGGRNIPMADGEAYIEIPDDSSAANRIKQVSHELRLLALLSKQPAGSGHADIQPEDEDPVVPLSGPLNYQGGSNTANFDIPTVDDEDYVEITLDIRDDSVTVPSVKPGCGGDTLARTLERQEQRRLASLSERTPGGGRVDRSKSAAAHALKGLKFISKTDESNGWLAVEKRFDELAKDGMLPKSLFSHCIGRKESKEFAGELFDALARRRNITRNSINKMELREFWKELSNQSFDSRLQIFFDMVDGNADGRITEEEVKEIISISGSTNRLSKIQDQAEEYARLIMEELDPNNLGYIEIYNLETLLLRMGTNDGHGHSDIQYNKPLKKRGGRKSTRFNIPESSSTVAPKVNYEVTGHIDRSKWPVVDALKGLKFTNKTDWSNGWLDRALRSSVGSSVKILRVTVYPGNFLALHVSKPQGFRYRSGQYMFVSGKAFSPFEWHPFFITSAPLDNYISVHIKKLGDSTRQLKTLFSGFCQPSTGGKSGLLRSDNIHSGNSLDPSIPQVLIDGPYGAPAQDYKKYEVVLLVGLGIGATPFISVVKDIINNMEELDSESQLNGGEDIEHGGSESESNRLGEASFKTRRAYFCWINEEHGSVEWFKWVMNEVAESDKKDAIELHNYCTGVYEEGDARSALIAMLQSLNHTKDGVDVVSGTKVKSHFGRPKWRNVYKSIALNHLSQRVGVFCCGSPTLTKELRELALDFSQKTTFKFDFHTENF